MYHLTVTRYVSPCATTISFQELWTMLLSGIPMPSLTTCSMFQPFVGGLWSRRAAYSILRRRIEGGLRILCPHAYPLILKMACIPAGSMPTCLTAWTCPSIDGHQVTQRRGGWVRIRMSLTVDRMRIKYPSGAVDTVWPFADLRMIADRVSSGAG